MPCLNELFVKNVAIYYMQGPSLSLQTRFYSNTVGNAQNAAKNSLSYP